MHIVNVTVEVARWWLHIGFIIQELDVIKRGCEVSSSKKTPQPSGYFLHNEYLSCGSFARGIGVLNAKSLHRVKEMVVQVQGRKIYEVLLHRCHPSPKVSLDQAWWEAGWGWQLGGSKGDPPPAWRGLSCSQSHSFALARKCLGVFNINENHALCIQNEDEVAAWLKYSNGRRSRGNLQLPP